MTELLCDQEETMKEVIEAFKKDKTKKKVWGRFKISKDDSQTLNYHTTSPYESPDPIALKTPCGQLLGNASILKMIGASHSYGSVSYNRSQTKIQAFRSR